MTSKCRSHLIIAALLFLSAASSALAEGIASNSTAEDEQSFQESIALPVPNTDGGIPLNEALNDRRSIRSLKSDSLTIDYISQLLWAAQGVTDEKGHRTAGSAFEIYPLEVYVLAGNVTGLSPGVYHYSPDDHSIEEILAADAREGLVNASVFPGNEWIKTAPATFLIAADFKRMSDRGIDISTVYIEAGLASQNLLLEVVSLGLGCTYVGGFNSQKASDFLNISSEEGQIATIALLPVGHVA